MVYIYTVYLFQFFYFQKKCPPKKNNRKDQSNQEFGFWKDKQNLQNSRQAHQGERTQVNKIKNEIGETTTDTIEI